MPPAANLIVSASNLIAAVEFLLTLRLFFDGGVSNDYRLRGDLVEFKANKDGWRTLDASDLAIHYRLNTEVARWLRRHSTAANPYGKIAG